ncbi:MAG: hypothetical protein ACOYO1_05960 [Bacteroidales bacterium]
MSIFNSQNKIIEIIEHDSTLLPVINRFGIKLGFGDVNIHQACLKNKINEDFFLAIINVFHNNHYFPEHKFIHFSISDIISYLIKTHHYYNSFTLPEIERLFDILVKNDNSHKEIIVLLGKIFSNFKEEFKKHIDYEENIIFPKIIEATEKYQINPNLKLKLPDFNFVNIHTQLDDKIFDIKNILFKYLPPIEDVNNCNAFAHAILRFEKDLKDHSRIEDRILYPRVKQFYPFSNPGHVE